MASRRPHHVQKAAPNLLILYGYPSVTHIGRRVVFRKDTIFSLRDNANGAIWGEHVE